MYAVVSRLRFCWHFCMAWGVGFLRPKLVIFPHICTDYVTKCVIGNKRDWSFIECFLVLERKFSIGKERKRRGRDARRYGKKQA